MTAVNEPPLPRKHAQIYGSPGAEALIWYPARGVVVTRVVGVLTFGTAHAITAAVRRCIAEDGRVVLLHDWEAMTNYDPPARVELTGAGRELRARIECSHILLRSRIVGLAVQAASLVIPSITVHSSRAALDAAIAEAILKHPPLGK